MKNIGNIVLISLVLLLGFSGCVPTRNLTYLKGEQQKNPDIGSTTPSTYSLDFTSYRLQSYDILGINVQSIVPSKYDLGTTEASNIQNQAGGQAQNPLLSGYTISDSGYVQVPLVGNVQVAGLTVDEAASKIKIAVEERFTEVIVKVQLLTFQVTMLGEVTAPGQITIYNMRMTTILDVMSLAGEPLVTADRQKVRILRRKGATLESYYVDITKDDILTSPLFYVQPGDIIYVEPIKGVKALQTNAPLINLANTLVNFVFFVTNIFLVLGR